MGDLPRTNHPVKMRFTALIPASYRAYRKLCVQNCRSHPILLHICRHSIGYAYMLVAQESTSPIILSDGLNQPTGFPMMPVAGI